MAVGRSALSRPRSSAVLNNGLVRIFGLVRQLSVERPSFCNREVPAPHNLEVRLEQVRLTVDDC